MGTDAFCMGSHRTYDLGVMQGFIWPDGHILSPEVDVEVAMSFLLSLARTPDTQRRHHPHGPLKVVPRASC